MLVACEYSGVVREAFRAKGHDAISCDLLPADDESFNHHEGSVEEILGDGWDLMIAHPPCPYLCNSGVQHLHTDPERWALMKEAAAFFRALWECDIPRKAIENPIMHGHAKKEIGCGQQTQIIQPWMFGHPEKKATCLWLKNLPLLVETDNVKEAMDALPKREQQRVFYESPGPDRWKRRSTTLQGVADAMAAQWSHEILEGREYDNGHPSTGAHPGGPLRFPW